MKSISCAVFGGNGGLGKLLIPYLWKMFPFTEIHTPTSKEVDLSWETSIEGFFAKKQIDVVINLAVTNVDSVVHKTSRYDVERQVTVNAMGHASILRHALPGMRARRFGRIIYISSVLANRPTPGTGIYAACKSFNETLTKVAAQENKSKGITCNVIRLGYFEAGLIQRAPEDVKQGILKEAGRFGKIDELATGISLLLANSYINGTVLEIDGGL